MRRKTTQNIASSMSSVSVSDQQFQSNSAETTPIEEDMSTSTKTPITRDKGAQGRYGCPYCHTNFAHPCLCRNHCGKIHPDMPVPSQVDMIRARYDDFRPPLPVKAFSCPLCTCSRKSYNGLLEHLRSTHSMKRESYPTRQACMLLSQKRNAEREVYVQYHRQMQQVRGQSKCAVCRKKLENNEITSSPHGNAKVCVCGTWICQNCISYDSGFCLSRGYINGCACGAHTGQVFGDRAYGIAWNILHPMSCDSSYSQSSRILTVPNPEDDGCEAGTVLYYGALNALIGAQTHLSEMGSRQYVQALYLPQLGATKTMMIPILKQRESPQDALDQRFFSDTLQDRSFTQYARNQLSQSQMDVVLVTAFDSSFLPSLKHSSDPNLEIQMICVRTPRAALINNQVLPELLHSEVVFAVVAKRRINIGEELTIEIRSEDPIPGIRHTVNTLYDHAERELTVLSNVLRQKDLQSAQTRPLLPMHMMH